MNCCNSISGCYIATTSCYILNMNYDNEFLTTLRSFRDNVMKKDKKYNKLLAIFDVIGPKISSALYQDSNRKIVSKISMLLIRKACNFIKEKKYEEAISVYIDLNKTLSEYFGIELPEITDDYTNKLVIEKTKSEKIIKREK